MLTCQEAAEKLQRIQQLNRQFNKELARVIEKPNMKALEKYYANLRKQIFLFSREIHEQLFVITVKDAVNPFHEQLKAGGISDEKNPEKKEITIDLEDVLIGNVINYHARGLVQWAETLHAHKDKITGLTPEQKRVVEYEIKNGAIPIWMPGKDVLLTTTIEQFMIAFKPVPIQYYNDVPMRDAFLEWYDFNNLIERHDLRLVEGVPETPYISFIRPTLKPDDRTFNKTITEQQAEFQKINQELVEAGLFPACIMNPYEYGALHTRVAEGLIDSVVLTPSAVKGVSPLDSHTYTRFINLPLSPGGTALGGFFDPSEKQIVFGGVDCADEKNLKGSFRIVTRVVI